MAGNHSGHMVSDFENAFQSCLAALTNEDHFNVHDPEEIKAGVEQTVAKFLEMAKQMECFFLQKRLLLSAQKPEQIVREDISDLKAELARKEILIQKHYEKIQQWKSLLSDLQGPGPRPSLVPNQNTTVSTPTPLVHPQAQQPPAPLPPPQPHPMSVMQQPGGGPSPMHPTSIPSPIAMMQVNQVMPPGMSQQPGVPPVGPPTQMYGPPQQPPPPPPQMLAQMGGGMVPPGPSIHTSGLQGPLAYLEKTTSNIGMPEQRQ